MDKLFISPESLRLDSYKLAAQVARDFNPDFIVAIWRGGAPIGCHVHEFLKRVGLRPDHISIRTSRYTGIDKTNPAEPWVHVYNLSYLLERLKKNSKVLLIDDVHDTGLSIKAIKEALQEYLKSEYPTDIRVATVYFKPSRNKTNSQGPEYYIHTTDQWLVFPHELEELSEKEILEHYGQEIWDLINSFN